MRNRVKTSINESKISQRETEIQEAMLTFRCSQMDTRFNYITYIGENVPTLKLFALEESVQTVFTFDLKEISNYFPTIYADCGYITGILINMCYVAI